MKTTTHYHIITLSSPDAAYLPLIIFLAKLRLKTAYHWFNDDLFNEAAYLKVINQDYHLVASNSNSLRYVREEKICQ